MTEKTYLIKRKCNNCSMENTLSIQRGITIEEFLKETGRECYYCGCSFSSNKNGGKKNE